MGADAAKEPFVDEDEFAKGIYGGGWHGPPFGYPYDAGDRREDLDAADGVARHHASPVA